MGTQLTIADDSTTIDLLDRRRRAPVCFDRAIKLPPHPLKLAACCGIGMFWWIDWEAAARARYSGPWIATAPVFREAQQYVAIKILHATAANREERLASLRREFYRTQMLSHRNIVNVFELDRDGDLDFFTMEYLEGELLSSVMQSIAAVAYVPSAGMGNHT